MASGIDNQTLNRTLLVRQGLVTRSESSPADALSSLVGLQAQESAPPYVALWNRISSFTPDQLEDLLVERHAVRAMMMRGTQHIVTSADYLRFQPLFVPILEQQQRSFVRRLAGADPLEIRDYAAQLLSDGSLWTRPRLSRALRERWPDADGTMLARTAQHLLAVVHPPPDGLWGANVLTPIMLARDWVGTPTAVEGAKEQLVLRYLHAFGPATPADIRAWSGIAGVREVLRALGPSLTHRRDHHGRDLVDVQDGVIADPDIVIRPLLMARFDNALQGYADRSRIVSADYRKLASSESMVLIDGMVAGRWTYARPSGRKRPSRLSIELFTACPTSQMELLEAEARALLAFLAPEEDSRLEISNSKSERRHSRRKSGEDLAQFRCARSEPRQK